MKYINSKETYLHQKFYTNIKLLAKNQTFTSATVSISGGQDSLCLIKLLEDLKKIYSNRLIVNYVYIDHQWKTDSYQQIEHLINLIDNRYGKIHIYQMNNIVNSETEARKLRYQLLINHSIKYKQSIIMTAHTETDKTETFINQIIRGTGIDGATSLSNKRLLNNNIEIWRPLLNFTRIEVNWFCRKYYLPIWSDISNYSYNINRNRIRNELLPYFKQYFHQNAEKKINHFIKFSAIDNEYIKQNSIKLYLISRHKKSIAINYSLIKNQHISLIIRTLQIFFYYNLNKTLDHDILYKLIDTLNHVSKDTIQIKYCNINIKVHRHWIYIY